MCVFFFLYKDDCRIIDWKDRVEGQALDGHVIATLNEPDEHGCQLQCYRNNDCISCNFGPSGPGGDNVCELNNSTDKRHLKPRSNFIYRGSEVRK